VHHPSDERRVKHSLGHTVQKAARITAMSGSPHWKNKGCRIGRPEMHGNLRRPASRAERVFVGCIARNIRETSS
jgi:hypothetical protein